MNRDREFVHQGSKLLTRWAFEYFDQTGCSTFPTRCAVLRCEASRTAGRPEINQVRAARMNK